MMWKAIGQSVVGTSHTANNKPCEDSITLTLPASLKGGDGFTGVSDGFSGEALICCVSDGAGSAAYAGWASATVTEFVAGYAAEHLTMPEQLTESNLYQLLELAYEELVAEATNLEVELNEFSCTLLLTIVLGNRAAFVQIGDGVIVRDDGSGFYTAVWWPDNGEYQNTTSFLVDDPTFANARISIVDEAITEVAMLTDGLQMLVLNMESATVHQPFFTDLFRYLRMADTDEKLAVLNSKLAGYLGSDTINSRTDDDKTLFLATRLDA